MTAALQPGQLDEAALRDLRSAGPADGTMPPPMQLALDASFGGFPAWQAEAGNLASKPGAQWVLLLWQADAGRLGHQVLTDTGAVPPEGTPVLAIAACGLTGSVNAASIGADVDWARVYKRFQDAVQMSSSDLGLAASNIGERTLIDVRRAAAYAEAESMLPGAIWRDPTRIDAWAAELPAGQAVVVYCVHGHDVSRAAAMRLRAVGLDAVYMEDGIDGWLAAGKAMAPMPGT